MVDIRLTVRLVLTYIGEIAQHVKASKFDVTTHGRRVSRTVIAGFDRGTLRVSADDLPRGLEVPSEPLVHHDRRGEVNVGASAHRDVLRQVWQRGLLGVDVRHKVPGGAVVEIDLLGLVGDLYSFSAPAREGNLGALIAGCVTVGQTNLAILVESVVIGDGVAAGGLDQHALVGFPPGVGGWQGGKLGGFDGGATGFAIDLGAATNFREVVVFPDGRGIP